MTPEEKAEVIDEVRARLEQRDLYIDMNFQQIDRLWNTGHLDIRALGQSPSELDYLTIIDLERTYIRFSWRLREDLRIEDLIEFRAPGNGQLQRWASVVKPIHIEWWPKEWKAYQHKKRLELSPSYRWWCRTKYWMWRKYVRMTARVILYRQLVDEAHERYRRSRGR